MVVAVAEAIQAVQSDASPVSKDGLEKALTTSLLQVTLAATVCANKPEMTTVVKSDLAMACSEKSDRAVGDDGRHEKGNWASREKARRLEHQEAQKLDSFIGAKSSCCLDPRYLEAVDISDAKADSDWCAETPRL